MIIALDVISGLKWNLTFHANGESSCDGGYSAGGAGGEGAVIHDGIDRGE